MRKAKSVWHVFFFIVIIGAAAAVVMLLWNTLIPLIIGWSAINYWQAVGLLVLVRILFGGFGHLRHGAFGHHHKRDNLRLHEELRGMSFNERREYIRTHLNEFHHCNPNDKPFASEEKKDDK